MRAITLAICCLLGALQTPALQAAPADCQAEGSFTVHLSSLDQQLLTILGAGANNGDTPELIRYNERTDSINKPILGNYARLRLAAMALRDGDKVMIRACGAYTSSYSSVGFNGFPPLDVIVL